jgi:hypothetical protein
MNNMKMNNNMSNLNFNMNQQPQNNFTVQQPAQNNQFNFNVNQPSNNNMGGDDDFNEVEEEDNTKPVENKNGLSNLLDSKLVNLDSLKGNGKSTNPNSMNYSGFNNNINKYNFY